MMTTKTFPEQVAPHDVVVTVIVSTANRLCGKLQPPEDKSDGGGGGNQFKVAMRSLGSKDASKLARKFHSLSNWRDMPHPRSCSINSKRPSGSIGLLTAAL